MRDGKLTLGMLDTEERHRREVEVLIVLQRLAGELGLETVFGILDTPPKLGGQWRQIREIRILKPRLESRIWEGLHWDRRHLRLALDMEAVPNYTPRKYRHDHAHDNQPDDRADANDASPRRTRRRQRRHRRTPALAPTDRWRRRQA